MNKKLAAFLAAWLVMASTFTYAQTLFSLNGSVTDVQKKPITSATIFLRKAGDSALV